MFNFKSLLNRPALLKIAGGYGPYCVANETFSSSMIVRWNCNVASKHVENELHLENLPNRGLMKISGPDAAKFLQGIITNDIKSLSSESSSMFTLFLNTKGRVMCDAMIYKPNEVDTFLIDCDVSSLAILEKHMKLYRVRSNVNITPVDELTVCVLYDPAGIESVLGHIDDVTESGPSNFHVKNNNYKRIQQILRDNHQFYRDPRLAVLGMRIISSRHIDVGKEINDKDVTIKKTALYLNYRYKLGIAEGSEIPNGVCFPFEINADFLNGVSFNKGCYIGQELTARTYHTGVVRKRIMPVYSSAYEFNDVEAGTPVKNSKDETKLPFGKFLAADGIVGIAILKVKEALTHQSLKIGNYPVKAIRPAWWPKEEDNLK